MATATQFAELMESCREMALSHLRPLMERMFENADVALLDFAAKAESNTAQALFFDAMAEVRKKRSAIEQHLFRAIKESFSIFPAKPDIHGSDQRGLHCSSLSLVDRNTVETSVAMLNASAKLNNRIMDRIFGLKQRLAVVNGGNAIEESEIPAGPAWLTAAFRHAVEHLELENKVRLVFIVLFEKYVLNSVDGLYDEFNVRLIQGGILPHLRYEVRKDAASSVAARGGAASSSGQAAQAAAVARDSLPRGADPYQAGDDVFSRILELMARRMPRQVQDSAGGGGPHADSVDQAPPSSNTTHQGSCRIATSPAPASGQSQLFSELTRLQSVAQTGTARLSSRDFIENFGIDEKLVERIQSTLLGERERLLGSVDRRKIPTADTNVIELVGMLFEYMLKEEHLPNVAKALLSRLHTPLLKVAVMDRTFFTRTQHPARKLLNDMTAAGIRWVDECNIERGIFPKMKEIVDRVLLEFEEDAGIFELFIQDFEQAVHELRQRARLVEQRNAEAAEGQDRLQAARRRAQQEIADLSRALGVDGIAQHFLQRMWADRLTFSLLRNPKGDRSADWQEEVSVARRVADSLVPPATDNAREIRRKSLEELQKELRGRAQALQQADREKLLLRLFEYQKRALETPPPARQQATASSATATWRASDLTDTAGQRREDTGTRARSAAIAQLEKVPFGTWFELKSDPRMPARRAKLSWRSTITENFMFVDQMGVKVAVLSIQELADGMASGDVHIIEQEKKPFVDRALQAIYRVLDPGAYRTASA